MVQRGERVRFAREAREAFRILREGLGEDLQRDVALQFRVARAIHLAHGARTKGCDGSSYGPRRAPGGRATRLRDYSGHEACARFARAEGALALRAARCAHSQRLASFVSRDRSSTEAAARRRSAHDGQHGERRESVPSARGERLPRGRAASPVLSGAAAPGRSAPRPTAASAARRSETHRSAARARESTRSGCRSAAS